MREQVGMKRSGLIVTGIVLSILTYWLFAQTFLNLGGVLNNTFHTSESIISLSISLTSLITGIFMVVAGNFSDRIGPVKLALTGIVLSIVGSLLIIISPSSVLLITGRVIQGFSAAMLMPSTISIINQLFEGDARRNALSWWSIGAFGGTGFASLFGGFISTYFGWQLIFILSIVFAVIGFVLLIGLRNHSFAKATTHQKFDVVGLILFTVMMAALSIFITQGSKFGWTSMISIVLLLTFIIGTVVFIQFEKRQTVPFIDLSIFKHRDYTSVAIGNFLMNMSVGTIAVFNMFVQMNFHMTPFQAGLMTLPYVIFLLLLVKIGEKSIKKYGPKKALVASPIIIAVGVLIISLTFLSGQVYLIAALIGFVLFGASVGLFATPALDTAISSLPKEKTGVASAIFKMASTLGAGFGIAILVTLFLVLKSFLSLQMAAMFAFYVNIVLVIGAFLVMKIYLPDNKKG